jgi:hypothetical protein
MRMVAVLVLCSSGIAALIAWPFINRLSGRLTRHEKVCDNLVH